MELVCSAQQSDYFKTVKADKYYCFGNHLEHQNHLIISTTMEPATNYLKCEKPKSKVDTCIILVTHVDFFFM